MPQTRLSHLELILTQCVWSDVIKFRFWFSTDVMWFWSSFNSDLNTDLTPISSYSDSDCDLMHVRFHLDLTLIPFWSQTKHVTQQTLILILIFFCFSSARDHFLKLFSVSSCHISKNGTKLFLLFHTLPCFLEIFLFPSRVASVETVFNFNPQHCRWNF